MICPFCHSENIKVIDTRKYDTVVVRVRLCLSCLEPFQTHEQLSTHPPIETVITSSQKLNIRK